MLHLDQSTYVTSLQGGLVEEDKPVNLTYCQPRKASYGRFNSIDTDIYFSSDPLNSGAPKYVSDCKALIQTELFTAGTYQNSSWCEEINTVEGGPEQDSN